MAICEVSVTFNLNGALLNYTCRCFVAKLRKLEKISEATYCDFLLENLISFRNASLHDALENEANDRRLQRTNQSNLKLALSCLHAPVKVA